ncbi:MAG: MFS transporter [Actinomycetota bacterium]|nr:MFS transporter [Actinomycetota bacterium]
MSKPARAELVQSPFGRLAVTHALGMAGDALVTLALAGSLFFSISPGAARGRVALYLLLTMAPFAVVSPLIGPLLDRNRGGRRMMVIVSSAGRALACIFMIHNLESLLLFPLAFTVLVLSKAYFVTKSALVPSTVSGERQLVEANARLAVLSGVAGFVAALPGLALLKIPFLGAPWVVGLAALVFMAAAATGFRLVRPADAGAPIADAKEKAELHAASIRLAATAMAVMRAMVGFFVFLTAFALRREGSPAWWFGVVLAASVVGSLAGAAVAPRLRRRLIEERILVGSFVLLMLVGLLATRMGQEPGIAVLALALGTAAAAAKLAFDSIVQRDAPDAIRGRTFASFETKFQLVWVAGAFIPVLLSIPSTAGMGAVTAAAGIALAVYLSGLAAARHRQEQLASGRANHAETVRLPRPERESER